MIEIPVMLPPGCAREHIAISILARALDADIVGTTV
jgi:hypothetical protein